MNADADALLDLAGAVSDGTSVDWPAVLTLPEGDPARGVIEEMVLLARIGDLHRTFETADRFGASTQHVDGKTPLARWGDLQVLERVGAGMAGEVFRAYDDRLQREVALKLFFPDRDSAASSALTEGRLLARVRHPSVVTVFGAAESEGRVGIWMEFIHGRTLAARLGDGGPLPVPEVVVMGAQLSDALETVHQAGLLHRDVKPQNVMLADDGRVVLMDFSAGRERLSSDQDVAGTPLFLAPELFDGASPSAQSDLYSLGVLLFFALTGSYPVAGQTVNELHQAHLNGARRSLTNIQPDLPAVVTSIVERALSPEPGGRFVSAAVMAQALREALRPATSSRSWHAPVIIAASLVAVAVAASAVWGTFELARGGGDAGAPSPPGTTTGASVHQLESTKFMLVGPPSPDGAWLPASNWPQLALDIVLLDAVTGQPRAEPKPTPDDSGGLTLRAVFSPDGRQLAYDWLTFPSPRETIYELRILDVATMATRTLEHRGMQPIGWASDANRLLVRSYDRRELSFIDVATGTLSTAGQLPADPLFVSFSPDREQAVFDQPASAGSTERDIFIADLAGWGIRPLVQHPSMDAQPVWLPDGSGVLFASDRAGSLGLWRLDVTSGEPSGEPRLVRPNIGKFRPLGFDRAGDLYYKVTGPIEVYTADVDLQQGGITNVKAASLSYLGNNLFSDWSPDGRRLVYVSRRGEVRTPGWESVVIRDLESGTERVIPTLLTIGNPRWSPDGQRIILPADGPQGPGDYLLSLADGSIQPLLLASRRPNFPSWMPDGRTMLYVWRGGAIPTIHSLDMSTRSTRPLVPDAGKFVISRSGDRVAFVTETGRPYGRVVVWERRTSTRLELGREDRDTGLDVVGWSPDDAEIVLSRHRGRGTDTELIAFPSRGGAARPIGPIAAELARNVRLNPDGTRISFEAGTGDWTAWVMRGFVETGRAGR